MKACRDRFRLEMKRSTRGHRVLSYFQEAADPRVAVLWRTGELGRCGDGDDYTVMQIECGPDGACEITRTHTPPCGRRAPGWRRST